MPTETRQCRKCTTQFIIEPQDFEFYAKVKVPPPTFCPDCRMQRRMAFRNERSLYKDNCDLCKKAIVSTFSQDKPFTVYCRDCWNSDKWDPTEYGRDYDFKQSFFEQFHDLMKVVPRVNFSLAGIAINSEFTNFCVNVKDVYLSVSTLDSENVIYSRFIDNGKDVLDCTNSKKIERCYENIDATNNYLCNFVIQTRDSSESNFLYDCVNCQACFMSSNLRNKQYVFRNKQRTKDQYLQLLKENDTGDYRKLEVLYVEFEALVKSSLHKFANVVKAVNSSGDNIENAKNSHVVFDSFNIENVKFSIRVPGGKDVYDLYGGARSELLYEGTAMGLDSNNCQFGYISPTNSNSQYIDWCKNCSDVFGSVGLQKKQYCIFNKQYSKEAYFELKEKIIAQMKEVPFVDPSGNQYRFGEFFPICFSYFAYNETLAAEYFPMTKEAALAAGYQWRDPDPSPHKQTLSAANLPNHINDTTESVLKEVLGCTGCGKSYKIIKQEFDLLKASGVALPRLCADCRYWHRFSQRNPLKLWQRNCLCGQSKWQNKAEHFHGAGKCPNEFQTPYAPERPEVVYCEQCYQAEVI
ncbi:hypothetical protein HY224_01495 [Candidatus Uhrbacteria bacterium]|nr:hypothetical protein [Candidatus Uhrbacteria bacterium]